MTCNQNCTQGRTCGCARQESAFEEFITLLLLVGVMGLVGLILTVL